LTRRLALLLGALLGRLRRWYCRAAHRDLWVHLPWGVICPKCGEVVTAWRGM
jgi:hypothetical protein